MNIDLYIYNGESKTSKLIAFSQESIGKDETIFSIPVTFGKWYYINVRNCSQESTKFFVRAKNYTNENGTERLEIQNITAKNALIAGKSVEFRFSSWPMLFIELYCVKPNDIFLVVNHLMVYNPIIYKNFKM